jgi:hypothetical protein
LTAHFGQWVVGVGRQARQWQGAAALMYGQGKKTDRRRKLVRGRPVLRGGTHAARRAARTPLGLRGRLNTALVARVNLTLRQSLAARIRRPWATMQHAPQLLLQLERWRADDQFVRPHESLRVRRAQPLERGGNRRPQRYRQRTPAMAAGLTNRRWTVRAGRMFPRAADPCGVRCGSESGMRWSHRTPDRAVVAYMRERERAADDRIRVKTRANSVGGVDRNYPPYLIGVPRSAVDAGVRCNGLERIFTRNAGIWQVVIYARHKEQPAETQSK